MKNSIKIALLLIITLSFSSVYAQEEIQKTQKVKTKSNSANDRTANQDSEESSRTSKNVTVGKQTQGATFGDKVKPQVNETEEGWEFVNVKLNDEQKINISNSMPNRISMNVSVGKASKKPSLDELLEGGNFFIKKEGLTKEQIDLVLKTKHDTAKNSVGNIR